MMNAQVKKIVLAFVVFFAAFSFGCNASSKNSLNEFYGEDVQYFFGLEELRKGDEEKAKKCFARCVQRGSYYPARRSFEQLALIGNVQERIKVCREFLKKYDDDFAKLFACREFIRHKEFSLALDATENLDFENAPNELVRLRLDLMERKKDSRLERTIYDWFTKRRISADHYIFYRENARDDLENFITREGNFLESHNDFSFNVNFIQQFRIAIYRGNYNAAFEMFDQIREMTITRQSAPLTYQLVADMGRACLNGSKENIANAEFFAELAQDENFSDKKIKYYALLYSGLLYNKSDNSLRRALEQFDLAIQFAGSEEECDQASWYYLQSCLRISVDEAAVGLRKYCAEWNEASYFDDFFDSLSVLLFSGGKWSAFLEIFSTIKNYASPAMVSKFAYITARIMQAGFLEGDDNEIEKAFWVAANCDAGTYVYYKLLAAKQLELSKEQIEEIFFGTESEQKKFEKKFHAKKITQENSVSQSQEFSPDEKAISARKLLLGYAEFGFAEKIYDEWLFFFEQDKRMIDLPTATKLAEFLRKLDDGQGGFYSKSLRMISRHAGFSQTHSLAGEKISRENFLLLYPQDFSEEVNSACAEFGISDYVMYALIRTESFFEPGVQSHAGAIGLTQLMEGTAADCAASLKVPEYDLHDPAVNVRFGTFYFSKMKSRLDDSQILALFAYNAGLTNVRRWIRGSKIQLDARGKISSDLFLETLPFSETRDYGRRVISAAAMYAWLYDGINPCDVVSEMM